jgi:glyoxylase-like metal-dependent hydrolase (beta-lactamase superfamily II)
VAAIEDTGRLSGFQTTPYRPFAGVTVREAGRHTPHHCVVEIRCADRTVAIAGDGAYLYRNLEEGRPVAEATDAAGNVADMQALQGRVGPRGQVLPGHEPQVFDRHPSGIDGLARICG